MTVVGIWGLGVIRVPMLIVIEVCWVHFHPMEVDDHVAAFKDIQTDESVNVINILVKIAKINMGIILNEIA
ncbi:hypothetical protein OB236_09765 [Paenibacillus sp. WQ 127069]|uniref:Uncharacterized protein n=2 Tax=Paenibacillus baimaensis TaxID=2982185 RepID=A0ABT2UCU3_9BACL|nr:hypothetical protein [Paenibacillus sp. WQ 127069]